MSISEFKAKHYKYSKDEAAYCCNTCDEKSINERLIDINCLIHHSSKEEKKCVYKYYCEDCDFGSSIEFLFNNHCKARHNCCYNNHSLVKK